MFEWLMRQVTRRRPAPPDLLWGPPADALPRDPELERRIAEDPDDVARLAVYADFLGEQGDPRGEVLAAWCRCEASPDLDLEGQIDRWQRSYATQLLPSGLGSLVGSRCRGPLLDTWSPISLLRIPDLGGVLAAPTSVAMREVSLTIGFGGSGHGWVEAIRERERPSPLRTARIAWTGMRATDVHGWFSAFEGLDEVDLAGHLAPLGIVSVPWLRALSLQNNLGHLQIEALDAPGLERLELGSANHGVPVSVLTDLPALRDLSLRGLDAAGLEALLQLRVAAQLERLSLAHSEDALAPLAAGADALPALRRLVVIEPERTRTPDATRRRLERSFGDRVTFVSASS